MAATATPPPDSTPASPRPANRAPTRLFEELSPAAQAVIGTRRRNKRQSNVAGSGGRQISSSKRKTRTSSSRTRPTARTPKQQIRSPRREEPRTDRSAAQLQERPPATDEELDFRHSHWWARRQRILAAMDTAHLPAARIDRFTNCGSDAFAYEDLDTQDVTIRANYCHDRWCQPCATARALMIADNVEKHLVNRRFRHIVLTMMHDTTPLAEQVSRLYANFKSLREKRVWLGRPAHPRKMPKRIRTDKIKSQRWLAAKARAEFSWSDLVDGGCAFLQLHVSQHDGLWHVHFHILAAGSFIPQRQLSQAWLRVTGNSSNVHISEVKDVQGAAREVARYAAKPADGFTTSDPHALAEIMRAANGRHLCFTFGDWRGHRLTKIPKRDETKRWRPLMRLTQLIELASRQDRWAIGVFLRIRTRTTPTTGPPHLFYRPDPLTTHAPTP
jgi:hypothetical protein